MVEQVSSDSMICIVDPTGKIRTHICETDYELLGYKAAGWKPVTDDWTKDRIVKQPIDFTKEMRLDKLANP